MINPSPSGRGVGVRGESAVVLPRLTHARRAGALPSPPAHLLLYAAIVGLSHGA